MRIAGVRKTSLVDGVGVNYVIFVQGCPHHCKECQNPSTWDYNGGYKVTLDEIKADILSNKLITGITFSGGEPLEQFKEVYKLAQWIKEQGLQTTLYTGYTLRINSDYIDCDLGVYTEKHIYPISWCTKYRLPRFTFDSFDYVIDGKFECDKKTLDLPFRGSSNQRILRKNIDY